MGIRGLGLGLGLGLGDPSYGVERSLPCFHGCDRLLELLQRLSRGLVQGVMVMQVVAGPNIHRVCCSVVLAYMLHDTAWHLLALDPNPKTNPYPREP